jgi:hypothetical protein
VPVGGNQDLQRLDKSGRNPEQCGTLPNRLPHSPKVTARKVAKTPVDDSQAVCRGGCPEVVLVDHRHRKTAQHRVPRRAGSENTGANDKEVERSVGKAWDIASHGGESGVESPGS